jgi:hypothetical protein
MSSSGEIDQRSAVVKELSGALPPTGFSNNYKTATEFKFQITFKISKEVEKLQIQKLVKKRSTTFMF